MRSWAALLLGGGVFVLDPDEDNVACSGAPSPGQLSNKPWTHCGVPSRPHPLSIHHTSSHLRHCPVLIALTDILSGVHCPLYHSLQWLARSNRLCGANPRPNSSTSALRPGRMPTGSIKTAPLRSRRRQGKRRRKRVFCSLSLLLRASTPPCECRVAAKVGGRW